MERERVIELFESMIPDMRKCIDSRLDKTNIDKFSDYDSMCLVCSAIGEFITTVPIIWTKVDKIVDKMHKDEMKQKLKIIRTQ